MPRRSSRRRRGSAPIPSPARPRAFRRRSSCSSATRPNGRTMAIALFETEDDYRQGDETLNSMSPPGGGMGQRVGVDQYKVEVHVEA